MLYSGNACLFAQEKGIASYYSNRLHGRRMSDGSKYHRDSLTCAHKRYPLGTLLKVTNLKNDKSIVVKVTDRCGSRRIIDLSYAAAKAIGIISAGIGTVRVEKYNEHDAVPYKRNDEIDIPEIDLEVSEKSEDYTPVWRKQSEESK